MKDLPARIELERQEWESPEPRSRPQQARPGDRAGVNGVRTAAFTQGSCDIEAAPRLSAQKTAPAIDGGQVALVLSCSESLIGGLRRTGPPERRMP
jgi:hypothetical protein